MATLIPARQGAHVLLHPDQRLRITNPSGHQVVDLWAITVANVPVWMSTAQTRSKLKRLLPIIGDTFVDTQRKPVLTLVEDTSPGIHDMMFPPCDDWRYTEANAHGHDSCAANFRKELAAAIKQVGLQTESFAALGSAVRDWGWTPEPLNLFMNVPVDSMSEGGKGLLQVARPYCKPGDFVVLKAETSCLVIMSACPNDLMNTNGGNPSDAAYEILD